MPARHLTTGQTGEDLAAAFLTEKGMRVVERNFRCAAGEIDLICRSGELLIFVEVKTRSSTVFGTPGEAVSRAKAARLARAASAYLSRDGLWSRPCRFDLVTVVLGRGGAELEHWEDVIDARDCLDSGHASWQPW